MQIGRSTIYLISYLVRAEPTLLTSLHYSFSEKKCPVCGKTFKNSNTLLRHLTTSKCGDDLVEEIRESVKRSKSGVRLAKARED